MSEDPDLPQPDRLEGAPHPRDTPKLFGQHEPEAEMLEALGWNRLHHAWLLSGPPGVGKATFAWRAAKYLLATAPVDPDDMFGGPPEPETLDTDPDQSVLHRISAGSEARLLVLRRPWDTKGKRLKQDITVDEARKLRSFFGLSSPDGGRRVVIVDAADDMNVNASNALLKLLEEPPANAVFLLVNHQPARLLATIRSRCRVSRFKSLNTADLQAALTQATGDAAMPPELTALAEGSVGRAIQLQQAQGPALYTQIVGIIASLPRLDRGLVLRLAGGLTGREAPARLDLILALVDQALTRLARRGATGEPLQPAAPNEETAFSTLCPDPGYARHWAQAASGLTARVRRGAAVNVDPQTQLLDLFHRLAETAPSGR